MAPKLLSFSTGEFKMNRLSPKTSAQDRAKIIAYVDLVLWTIMALLAIILIIVIGANYEELVKGFFGGVKGDYADKKQVADIFFSIAFIIGIIIGGVQLYLNLLLLNGAKERNARKINRWVIIISVLFVFSVLSFFMEIYEKRTTTMFAEFIGLVYRGITIWMVHGFLKELRAEQNEDTAGGVIYGQDGENVGFQAQI